MQKIIALVIVSNVPTGSHLLKKAGGDYFLIVVKLSFTQLLLLALISAAGASPDARLIEHAIITEACNNWPSPVVTDRVFIVFFFIPSYCSIFVSIASTHVRLCPCSSLIE